ncbi:MAG TPA: sulfotransferase, partial [Rhodanobacteraceae bacterium]|nr:sulfotransferase [Rhodanobacteraceae bacterium]
SGHAEPVWLERGRALVLRGDVAGALAVFAAAHAEHPQSSEIGLALAGLYWQAKRADDAEALLRRLLAVHPEHAAATLLLAKILKEQARMNAVADVVGALFARAPQPVGLTIQAIELLDDAGMKDAAAAIAEAAIARGSTDPRLYAYSGMLHLQLGDFARVRECYTYALEHGAQALDWQVANGLAAAQRYADANHADFALFEQSLRRSDLTDRARASVLFALGKAYDDIGDPARAAGHFRDGNRVVAGIVDWSRKNFRRTVAARLDAKPIAERVAPSSDFVPVFIVGMPRSGTTLVADLLSRHADVRYRGELGWMPFLALELGRSARPGAKMLEDAAATYRTQVRQDDAPARFYIDKQPLNFLNVDLIAALFPNARIIHCERNERDTALSIWMQYFAGPEHNFAYDFADIAAVMQGCDKLMAQAKKRGIADIRTMSYERLASDAQASMRELATWLGLGDSTSSGAATISTSSLWQVRQPVYTRSIGRWRAYAPHVPELMQFSAGDS